MNYGIYQSADKMAIDFIIIGSVILSTSFCILYLKLTFYHKSKHMSSIDLKVLKKLWVLSRDAAKKRFFSEKQIIKPKTNRFRLYLVRVKGLEPS